MFRAVPWWVGPPLISPSAVRRRRLDRPRRIQLSVLTTAIVSATAFGECLLLHRRADSGRRLPPIHHPPGEPTAHHGEQTREETMADDEKVSHRVVRLLRRHAKVDERGCIPLNWRGRES
jgi:hypothetical protein